MRAADIRPPQVAIVDVEEGQVRAGAPPGWAPASGAKARSAAPSTQLLDLAEQLLGGPRREYLIRGSPRAVGVGPAVLRQHETPGLGFP